MKSLRPAAKRRSRGSHPARGAWIEMVSSLCFLLSFTSHPARGAWIESPVSRLDTGLCLSHPARGAWIEIFRTYKKEVTAARRTPHGVRGLKY